MMLLLCVFFFFFFFLGDSIRFIFFALHCINAPLYAIRYIPI